VISPGIDIADYAIALPDSERNSWFTSWGTDLQAQYVLLTVGRLVRRKGIAPFVSEALPLLAAKRRDWVYLIVGDGPERHAIEAIVESRGLSGHVRLLGRLNDRALKSAYALADLFVMPNVPVPNDPEGFGLVVLEAQASGVPVVAADLEGICEALGGKEDGTLIKPGDWSAFVEAINAWLDRDETVADREQRRQRTASRSAWSCVASQYIRVFREVTEEYHARRGKQDACRN